MRGFSYRRVFVAAEYYQGRCRGPEISVSPLTSPEGQGISPDLAVVANLRWASLSFSRATVSNLMCDIRQQASQITARPLGIARVSGLVGGKNEVDIVRELFPVWYLREGFFQCGDNFCIHGALILRSRDRDTIAQAVRHSNDELVGQIGFFLFLYQNHISILAQRHHNLIDRARRNRLIMARRYHHSIKSDRDVKEVEDGTESKQRHHRHHRSDTTRDIYVSLGAGRKIL